MPAPIIDAVAVTSRDIARSVAFYRRLGFDFPDFGPDDRHVEAIAAPGAVRLMIDAHSLAAQMIGAAPRLPRTMRTFALLFDSPADVDAAADALRAAGESVVAAPFDAVWGQRYATVADPDGYRVDLFAPF